jgi:hypothetical protein
MARYNSLSLYSFLILSISILLFMKEKQQEENNLQTEHQNKADTVVDSDKGLEGSDEKPENIDVSVEDSMNIPEQKAKESEAAEKMVEAEEQPNDNIETKANEQRTVEDNQVYKPENSREEISSEKPENKKPDAEENSALTANNAEENKFSSDDTRKANVESIDDKTDTNITAETESAVPENTENAVIMAEAEATIGEPEINADNKTSDESMPELDITGSEAKEFIASEADSIPEVQQTTEETTETEEGDDVADHDEEGDAEMEELESSEHYTDLDPGDLITRMEELVKEQDHEPVRKKFFALRKAYFDIQKQERDKAYQNFINEGGAIEDYQMPAPTPGDESIRELTQQFKQKLTEKRERREKEKQENLAAKRQVIENLKLVIQNEADILHAFDAIHELQAKWRSIGIVPLDQAEDLWQSYRFYVGKFYDLIRIHKELQELDQKKNLEAKVSLCGQAEDLLLESSVNKAISQLRELQYKWRDIGPVPRENNEEIWDRFKAAADKIYERRRNHIESLQGEQEANLIKKTELCEKAEKLVEHKPGKPGEWQKVTEELRNIQQEWKQIGPAPRQQNEKVWQRFRAAGDKHFNDKKDYFSTLKREQDINKQKKTDICVQAESLKDSTEWKETADALKNLQEEWKNIGPVHPKYSQKLWERFRSACDAFFSQRSQHHSELDKEFTENLTKKTVLLEEIEQFEPSENKSQDLEKLKESQKQWSEIGRVPIKVKDKIYQRYRRALDKCYEKLNLSSSDRRNLTSSNRIQQLEQQGKLLTQKDKSSVRYKIDRLQDEIRLLENNIGFFSNSKGANKLKEDYEKKIEQAKEEVSNLKTLLSKS